VIAANDDREAILRCQQSTRTKDGQCRRPATFVLLTDGRDGFCTAHHRELHPTAKAMFRPLQRSTKARS
jgi:hypothetical protein